MALTSHISWDNTNPRSGDERPATFMALTRIPSLSSFAFLSIARRERKLVNFPMEFLPSSPEKKLGIDRHQLSLGNCLEKRVLLVRPTKKIKNEEPGDAQ